MLSKEIKGLAEMLVYKKWKKGFKIILNFIYRFLYF